MPVSSYAPEFLEIFKKAHNEELIIPLGDNTRATRLRFRLNMLRKAMRKEGHTLTTIANSVQFLITSNGDLRCIPADGDFLKSISKAGIKISPPVGYANEPSMQKTERAEAEEAIRKFMTPKKEGK